MSRPPLARIFLVAFAVYALHVWPIPAPLTLRQLYLSRSLTEGHAWVDPYAAQAGDVVLVGEHLQVTTPPLTAALGMPAVLAAEVVGLAPRRVGTVWTFKEEILALVPFTLLVGGAAGALAVTLLALGLATRGEAARDATLGALAFAFATPLLDYAVIAQSEALAALGAVLAFLGLARAARPPGGDGKGGRAGFVLAGLGLGVAVLADHHAAAPAVAMTLALALFAGPRSALLAVLGGTGPALLLFAWNYATTGNPLESATTRFAIGGEKIGFPYGAPGLVPLLELAFGPAKGLFLAFPILLVGALGLALESREAAESERWLPRVLLAGAAAVLLANASIPARGSVSWFSWESFGPRHALLAGPLLAPGIPRGLARTGRVGLLLAATSFVFALAGAEASWQFPLYEPVLELLRLGPRLRGATILTSIVAPGTDAELAGLLAAIALLPLVLALASAWLAPTLGGRAARAPLAALGVGALVLLSVPWIFLGGRGHEEEWRRGAAKRSLHVEAGFTRVPRRFLALGFLMEGLGDAPAAADLHARAIEGADADTLGEVLRALDRLHDPRALQAARALRAARPNDPELAIVRAETLLRAGRRDDARVQLETVLRARPDVADRPELAAVLRDLGLSRRE